MLLSDSPPDFALASLKVYLQTHFCGYQQHFHMFLFRKCMSEWTKKVFAWKLQKKIIRIWKILNFAFSSCLLLMLKSFIIYEVLRTKRDRSKQFLSFWKKVFRKVPLFLNQKNHTRIIEVGKVRKKKAGKYRKIWEFLLLYLTCGLDFKVLQSQSY